MHDTRRMAMHNQLSMCTTTMHNPERFRKADTAAQVPVITFAAAGFAAGTFGTGGASSQSSPPP